MTPDKPNLDRLLRATIVFLVVLSVPSLLEAQGGRPVDLRPAVLDAGLDPDEILRPLALEEGARSWVRSKIPRGAPEVRQLEYLLEALQFGEGMSFKYRAGHTGTVQEVFDTGEYNCLSFSMLFVALAREVGLPAYYLKVDQLEDYEREGDLVVLSRHITAGYGFVKDRTVLEFDLGPEISYNLAYPISDLDALALYYSNRGAEMLREGKADQAIEQLEISVALAPKSAQAWINLGVAHRRLGDFGGAEAAYLRAIEIEKGRPAAFHNMVILLRLRGEDDAAGEVLARLAKRKNRNPFTFLALGDLSLDEGRVDDAGRFYRRALALAKFEAEPRAAMGQWALANGQRQKAASWLERARQADAESPRVLALEKILLEGLDAATREAAGESATGPISMPRLVNPKEEEEAPEDSKGGGL